MSDFDPSDIRGQERAKADADLRKQLAGKTEGDDLRWLMGSKRGRRIVWRLLSQSGVFQLSFNTNAMQMSFAEGRRSFGNHTLALIHTLCPELYPLMVKESVNEHRDNDDR